ncbi:MAG: ParB/RepB/Spo0J family partition protein [Victivallaceae bacterium]
MQDTLLEVPSDSIRISPFQPRRHFSEEELRGLANSIESIGLLQPPVVREVSNNGTFLYYELIAGERRWRALKLLGREKIEVLVRSSEDSCAAEAALAENLQRVDLNPIEMAEAFRRFMDAFQLTQDNLALRVGKKRSTVANYLRLLTFGKEIRNLLISGELTMGHAKVLLTLNSEKDRNEWAHLAIKRKLPVRDLERLIESRDRTSLSFGPGTKSKQNLTSENLIRFFKTRFGMEVKFKPLKTGGCFVLSYKEEEVLDSLERFFKAENQKSFET